MRLRPDQRPSRLSPATVHRDVVALRAEWAAVRLAAMDAVLGEEIARLNALEDAWWDRAVGGEPEASEATKHVLAIQKQRTALLHLGHAAGRRSGLGNHSGALAVGAATQDGAMQLNIRWLDDWRSTEPSS